MGYSVCIMIILGVRRSLFGVHPTEKNLLGSQCIFYLGWVWMRTGKALTGLDRKSAHLLQLHAVKRSCCTAANSGATGRLSPWVMPTQWDNRTVAPWLAAVQQLRFTAWSCNRWADFLSNPVRAFMWSLACLVTAIVATRISDCIWQMHKLLVIIISEETPYLDVDCERAPFIHDIHNVLQDFIHFLIGVDSLMSANCLLYVRLLQSCIRICQLIKLLQERPNSFYVRQQFPLLSPAGRDTLNLKLSVMCAQNFANAAYTSDMQWILKIYVNHEQLHGIWVIDHT